MSNINVAASLHDEAIKYANRGMQVVPIVSKNTLPIIKWKEEATTDLNKINTWWTRNPQYNIGILAGEKSGIIVIDFITPKAWAAGQAKGLPVTPVVKTGTGYQVYCKYQEGINYSLGRDNFNGFFLIGDGRYVVAPPSIIDKGVKLSWVDDKGLDDLELGDVPDWVFAQTPEVDDAISEPIPATAEGITEISDSQGATTDVKKTMIGSEIIELPSTLDTKTQPPLPEAEVLAIIDSNLENECEALPTKESDWKAPVLFEGVGVEEIKAELLPSWLGDYAGAISQSKQTPEGLAVMLGLSIVATCVQKRFEVSPYGDDEYSEPLSLWTVTVMRSAERKSPVLNAMMAPIIAWEKEQAKELKKAIDETSTQIQIGQKRIDKLQHDASKAPDSEARQKLISKINEIKASMPLAVRAPRLWIGDVTAETLQDMLAENGEKMAVLSDEGGIFEIMAGLYTDNKVNIDIFLQAYSGSPARIKRKLRDVSLERPALTFGLAVQPVVIEGFASGSKKQFRGKGALGRFLFCIPKSMLGRRVAGRRVPISADIKSRYDDGIRGLLSVPKTVDEAGEEMPRMLELDDEALGVWENFDRRVEVMLGPNGELAVMGDWGGKLPGTVLRIAGLLHLVENGPDRYIIGKDTLDRSIGLCILLMGHTKAAFGLIGADAAVSDAKKVFMWMQKNSFKVFTKTECSRALKGISELDNALKTLEDRNILKELMVPSNGRDAANYISNPILKPTFG